MHNFIVRTESGAHGGEHGRTGVAVHSRTRPHTRVISPAMAMVDRISSRMAGRFSGSIAISFMAATDIKSTSVSSSDARIFIWREN